MAKPGPKKTPKRVLKLRGSWRADLAKDDETPVGRPECPAWVKGEAKKEWDWICDNLESMGILAVIDRTMLELYVTAYIEWRKACKDVKKTTEKTKNGNTIQSPELSIRNKAWDRLKKVCAEFGMSPAARTGIAINPKQPAANDKSRFFNKNKGSA